MSDDDLDPSELLNRRIAAVLGDSDSDDAYVAPVEDDVDPELKKQRQIDKMLAEGWVLPEESNKFAPPARAPPLPPRKTTAPAGVFQTKIDYDASHMWRGAASALRALCNSLTHFQTRCRTRRTRQRRRA